MNWSFIIQQSLLAMVGLSAMSYAIASLGLNVQFGYAGLLNFGQAGFMACGAYGLGMTSHYFNISMWWGIPIGIGFAVILGLLMGAPTLKLRADYLAIVTIAAAEIIRLVVRSQTFTEQFGGSNGINNFSGEFREVGVNLGLQPGQQYGFWFFKWNGSQLWILIVGWATVAIFGVLIFFLMRSPWGRVLKAIREDEEAVRSLGKNVYSYKMQALILGGVIGAFGGMFLALRGGSVQPDTFSRDVTFFILTALVLGGVARVSGSIVGAMLYWGGYVFLDNVLREATKTGPIRIFGINVLQPSQVGNALFVFVGIGLILLLLFRPQGIFGNRKEMAFDVR
ncbi:MAG: branched-chain amino acid ABC transporter permease [Nocardiopsis sp. BM-2018]|nr:MAG: branched-chain amino acid ABC transporter permease [Nocardiopsis sp. BM-2018]